MTTTYAFLVCLAVDQFDDHDCFCGRRVTPVDDLPTFTDPDAAFEVARALEADMTDPETGESGGVHFTVRELHDGRLVPAPGRPCCEDLDDIPF